MIEYYLRVPTNVNNLVRVKLTEVGHVYHLHRHVRLFPTLKYDPPQEDSQGWSEWQLWHLMQVFGDQLHNGGPNYFATGIEFVVDKSVILNLGFKERD